MNYKPEIERLTEAVERVGNNVTSLPFIVCGIIVGSALLADFIDSDKATQEMRQERTEAWDACAVTVPRDEAFNEAMRWIEDCIRVRDAYIHQPSNEEQ